LVGFYDESVKLHLLEKLAFVCQERDTNQQSFTDITGTVAGDRCRHRFGGAKMKPNLGGVNLLDYSLRSDAASFLTSGILARILASKFSQIVQRLIYRLEAFIYQVKRSVVRRGRPGKIQAAESIRPQPDVLHIQLAFRHSKIP